jgi:hypothetical protein
MEELDIKLDMLTITGVISNKEGFAKVLNSVELLQLKPCKPSNSYVYNKAWRLGEHAFIEIDTVKNNARVDFNPSKVDQEEKVIRDILGNMKGKKYTRIDLAQDMKGIDFSHNWTMKDDKSRKIGLWLSGATEKMETMYRGTYNSDSQVILYNKALEQNRRLNAMLRKDRVSEEEIDKLTEKEMEDLQEKIGDAKKESKYSNWWRIEERIRGDKAENWEDHNWFDGITIVNKMAIPTFPEGTKANMQANVLTCMQYPSFIDNFAEATKVKIRKVIRQLTYEDGQAFSPSKVLEKEKAPILAEIEGQLKAFISYNEIKLV